MKSIDNLIKQYQVLTYWYISVLDDIPDTDGNKTLSDNTNSLEWIAGHLLVGRYRNIVRIGVQIEPYKYLETFINQTLPPPNAIAFNKETTYPNLTECRNQWLAYSNIFINGLKNIDEAILSTELPFGVPTGGKTIEDALTFVSLHETFHIGQMSILRKLLGHSAMNLNPGTK
jgi:uncharacterized damage-inducible protein DinB